MNLVSRIGFYTVTVSKTQITYNGWTGVGYIIIDPSTGASAFEISGGLSGSGNTQKSDPLVDFLNGTFDGSSLDIFRAILKLALVSTDFITKAFKIAGPIAMVITAIETYMEIMSETNNRWKAAAAATIDILLGVIAGAIIGMILTAAFELSAAIITILVAVSIIQLFENLLLYVIVNALFYYNPLFKYYVWERWSQGYSTC
ncbi:MAG: hypothetical protein M1381_09255 [Deltaproteobacteria bacterium]|nr:hypothetical protein [Deltaproteobacteria bacterium]MCL5792022.1 hypothetical protein [Deltaproteobacteria bacterium]